MSHSDPLSCFSNLSLSTGKITLLTNPSLSITQLIHSISHFWPTIFTHLLSLLTSQIFTVHNFLHRFSQISTDLHSFILPSSLYLSIFHSAPCLQDLHRSSTDLSKIFQKFSFLHPLSLGTWTVGHSGPLSSFPSPSFSSLFPSVLHRSSTDLPKIFILPSSPTAWYLDSRSFRPTLQISKSFLFLPYPYSSSQIFHRSPKNFSSSIPYYLVPGQSVIPAHSPAFQVPPFPPLSLHFFTDPPQIFQNFCFFLHPLLLGFWTVGHSGPLSSLQVPYFPPFPHSSSSIFHRSFQHLSSSIPYTSITGL